MTVYCPMCGSANLSPHSDPVEVARDEISVIYWQLEQCGSCRHKWRDEWLSTERDGEIVTETITPGKRRSEQK